MPPLRLRDLIVAVFVAALVLAVARDPVGRSLMIALASLVGAVLTCRYGLQASGAAWDSADRSGGEGFGSILRISVLCMVAVLVVGLLCMGTVLFGALAVLRMLPA